MNFGAFISEKSTAAVKITFTSDNNQYRLSAIQKKAAHILPGINTMKLFSH